MITVLLVDDHQLVLDGLKLMLSGVEDIECVGEANTGLQALEILKSTSTDVVLLDINMPNINGIETCKIIQEKYPATKVIVLSMLQEASMIKAMLKYGAKGYLLKNAGQDEVVKAIRTVAKGQPYYSPVVTQIIMTSLSPNTGQPASDPNFPKISRREKQVLKLIVEEHTTAEIAEKLFISPGTVETHRRNLLLKLDARNTAGLVRKCIEYGLLER